MDHKLEDLELSDTESISHKTPHGLFCTTSPIIFGMQDVTNEKTPPDNQDVKRKNKKKKGKKTPMKPSSEVSSESGASSVVPPVMSEPGKEEFYDAHGSFHTTPVNLDNHDFNSRPKSLGAQSESTVNEPKFKTTFHLTASQTLQTVPEFRKSPSNPDV